MPSRPGSNAASASAAFACLAFLAGCATTPDQGALAPCATPLDPRIENSCVVTSQVLWRGARPDTVGAAALVERGVRTVVNLEWLNDDRKAFDEARVPGDQRYDVQYYRVPDWEPLVVLAPRKLDDHVAHFLALTRTQPKPIFVHCRSGQNRTGVMVAAYRVFDGADIDDAIAEMERYGGAWFKYDAEYIRSLTPQRRVELERRIADWIPKLRRDARILCSNSTCTAAPD